MLAPQMYADVVSIRADIAKFLEGRRRRRSVCTPDFEDELQEVLTEILRSLPLYRRDVGEFRPWAFGIAIKVHLRFARQRKRRSEFFSEDELKPDDHKDGGVSPERRAQLEQARRRIAAAFDGMTTEQYAALYLHVYEGQKHEQVARELGISLSYSKKLVQRAREYLASRDLQDDTFFSTHPPISQGKSPSADLSTFLRANYDWMLRTGHFASLISIVTLAKLVNPAPPVVLWLEDASHRVALSSPAPPSPLADEAPPSEVIAPAHSFTPAQKNLANKPKVHSADKPSPKIVILVKPRGKTLVPRKTR